MSDNKKSPINVGFVGLSTQGWASNVLGPSLQDPSQRSNYSLVASAIAGHPVKAYSGSTSQIASDPNVDFVAISVKAPNHKDALTPVIEAGKDFFIEWPAGTGLAQAKELAEKAKKHKVRSLIGLQGRQAAVVQKTRSGFPDHVLDLLTILQAKGIIDSGKIGQVHSSVLSVVRSREEGVWGPFIKESLLYTADENNGVTMFNIAVGHHIDTLTYVLGGFASVNNTMATMYPEAVVVHDAFKPIPGKPPVPQTAPDHVTFSGILKSGALSTNTWQAGAPAYKGRREFTWTIVGEKGTLEISSDQGMISIFSSELLLDGEKVKIDGPGEVMFTNISRAWSAFASARRGEPEGAFPTIEDAVKTHELLEAIQRSAKEGQTIQL